MLKFLVYLEYFIKLKYRKTESIVSTFSLKIFIINSKIEFKPVKKIKFDRFYHYLYAL